MPPHPRFWVGGTKPSALRSHSMTRRTHRSAPAPKSVGAAARRRVSESCKIKKRLPENRIIRFQAASSYKVINYLRPAATSAGVTSPPLLPKLFNTKVNTFATSSSFNATAGITLLYFLPFTVISPLKPFTTA